MKQYSFIDKEEIEINCYKWESKEKNIKGVVQIVHGMTEHALRYDFFARKLTEEGYIVYAHDHRGHGKTALSKELFGYIADDDGFNWMVSDVKEHLDLIKKEIEEEYDLSGMEMDDLFEEYMQIAEEKAMELEDLMPMYSIMEARSYKWDMSENKIKTVMAVTHTDLGTLKLSDVVKRLLSETD